MGHERRMKVLARSLAGKGIEVATVATDEHVKADVIVVDSYRFRADDQAHFQADLVVAVDDLYRDLAVDVVVDPSPGACAEAHLSAANVLAGPSYALIDSALVSSPVRKVSGSVQAVVVATGAGDDRGVGAAMAKTLAGLLGHVSVRLAVGPWATAAAPAGVVAIRATDGLGPELAEADLVLTAAGVTMLEALALGRPTIAFVLADNQRQGAEGAAAAGAVVLADVEGAPVAAAKVAASPGAREALSEAARHLVDGHGAQRVADRIMSLV
jgi:spore coat polysaccharide biosynthesis predicted glycosyltransferase SpsG